MKGSPKYLKQLQVPCNNVNAKEDIHNLECTACGIYRGDRANEMAVAGNKERGM